MQKATTAKTETEKSQIIENAQTDILGQQAENKGANITKEQLVAILNKYFIETATDLIPDEVSSEEGHDRTLTTIDEKYTINLSEIFKGKFLTQNNVVTLGEKYDEYENNNNSLIGKSIDYTSANNDNDIQILGGWIILGKQVNAQGKNDVIITTKNPVSTLQINNTLAEWTESEIKINNACKNYVGENGTLGTKSATIKNVRSITLDDINNAVGFKETINSISISNSNGGYAYPNSEGNGWVKNTDSGYSSWPKQPSTIKEAYYYYNDNGTYKFGSATNGFSTVTTNLEKAGNMTYILANNTPYWVASRTVNVNSEYAYFFVAYVGYGFIFSCQTDKCYSNASGGMDRGGDPSMALRPCIVLSSEIPWDDVKDLIED